MLQQYKSATKNKILSARKGWPTNRSRQGTYFGRGQACLWRSWTWMCTWALWVQLHRGSAEAALPQWSGLCHTGQWMPTSELLWELHLDTTDSVPPVSFSPHPLANCTETNTKYKTLTTPFTSVPLQLLSERYHRYRGREEYVGGRRQDPETQQKPLLFKIFGPRTKFN
jgi:hypothetical protein